VPGRVKRWRSGGVAREKARLLSAAGCVARRATAPGDSTRGASQAFWRGFAGVLSFRCSERMRARIFSEGSETVPELVRVMPRG
jgi:hypothetical protein